MNYPVAKPIHRHAMPGTPQPSGTRDTVFSAIRLNKFTARRAAGITRSAYEEHGLDGKPRPLDHFHITVVHFGLYLELGDEGISRASRACGAAAARIEPFQAQLNQLKSFSARPGRAAPLVLVNDRRHTGEAVEMGLAEGKPPKFTPHVTTAYSMRRIPPQPVGPISWKVTELVLIHSFVGRTKYEELGRWSLGA